MMSSNVALLHSNNCCVLEPAICEDLDLHVVIFLFYLNHERKYDMRHGQRVKIIFFCTSEIYLMIFNIISTPGTVVA